ncbi:MAG: heavy metal-binding domain-containing protein [Candidatus Sumerlaeaceae bacterium]|nr:heavy metal-binding domain-containing protein [Candidatus Sumerlaeaceae bacterium]
MFITTTATLDGKRIVDYRGIVVGDVIFGANVFRDFFASIRDVVGGRVTSYEKVFGDAREQAIAEMVKKAEALGANAVVGVDIDYEVIGQKGSMLLVTAAGTAVVVQDE